MKKSIFLFMLFIIFVFFSACNETGDIDNTVQTEMPEIETPKTETSKAEMPKTETPKPTDEIVVNDLKDDNFDWEGDVELEGIIGDNMKVHMELFIKDNNVTGQYYYDKIGKHIGLTGMIEDTSINLTETYNGEYTGKIVAIISRNNTIDGVWTHYGNDYYPIHLVESGKKLPKYIEPNVDIIKFAGEWKGIHSEHYMGSRLIMTPVFDNLIYFDLLALNGTHNGGVCEFAVFEDGVVIFDAYNESEDEEVTFKFSLNSDGDVFLDCSDYRYQCGVAVEYDTAYTKDYSKIKYKNTIEIGLTDEQEETIKNISGKYYEFFIEHSQTCDTMDNLDDFDADIYVIGIVGWRNAGIIMINKEDGTIMAAIDYDRIDDLGVKYFTNSPNFEEPPKTIQAWAPWNRDH